MMGCRGSGSDEDGVIWEAVEELLVFVGWGGWVLFGGWGYLGGLLLEFSELLLLLLLLHFSRFFLLSFGRILFLTFTLNFHLF